jgi:hypothetical protein
VLILQASLSFFPRCAKVPGSLPVPGVALGARAEHSVTAVPRPQALRAQRCGRVLTVDRVLKRRCPHRRGLRRWGHRRYNDEARALRQMLPTRHPAQMRVSDNGITQALTRARSNDKRAGLSFLPINDEVHKHKTYG